jgi:hypothetical protein
LGLRIKDGNYGGLFNGLCFGVEDHDTKGKRIQDWFTNHTHFLCNRKFKVPTKELQGPLWEIFVEFLEHSCTIEFLQFF